MATTVMVLTMETQTRGANSGNGGANDAKDGNTSASFTAGSVAPSVWAAGMALTSGFALTATAAAALL